MSENVAILGASDSKDRFSYRANKQLKEKGHKTFLISPKFTEIEGEKVYKDLSEVSDIDTLTLYVNPTLSTSMMESILKLKPKRVIFNPGTENPQLAQALKKNGISFEEACTLVLLTTDQF